MTEPREIEAAPAGEQIHMPAASVIPLINAAALAITIVGVTTSIFMVVAGGIVFLATTIKWIADTRRDIEALPADHH
jgi:hypothetical protein